MFLSGSEKTMQLEAIYVYCHFADVTDVDFRKKKPRERNVRFCDRIKVFFFFKKNRFSMLIESRE